MNEMILSVLNDEDDDVASQKAEATQGSELTNSVAPNDLLGAPQQRPSILSDGQSKLFQSAVKKEVKSGSNSTMRDQLFSI